MNTAEIKVRIDIKRDRRFMVFQFLAESIGEAGEAALLHPKRQILALDVGR